MKSRKYVYRAVALSLALLMVAMAVLTGCGARGKTAAKAGKTKISVSVYALYLSRMKGDLARAGMEVTSDAFWASYVSTDNTTYEEHYTQQVRDGMKQMAAALILYEEKGLSLPKEEKDAIDTWIDQMIEDSGEGSKNKLNSLLSAYGANVTTLRDAAEIEAKVAQLKEHLYGKGGSLISATVREEFYQATYFRGHQMLIANTYYDRDKDEDGSTVYYVKNDQGLASAKIAYDTKNGKVTEEKDKNGDSIYRLDNTLIAYDKENGVPNYKYDANGEQILKKYTEAEMQTRLKVAEEIAKDCKGNVEKFLDCVSKYSDNLDFTEKFAPNGMYFSTAAYATDTVFGTFATELVKLEDGEVALLQSDAGYYLLQRVPLDAAAWEKEANKQWFSTFTELVIESMLQQKTEPYLDQVEFDEDVLDSVSIVALDPNYYY